MALFIDEAHDLKRDTLVGLKRLMEVVHDGGGILSVVLAGHPKLNNELRRPTNEEIGNRATMFSLDNVHGANREYIHWLLEQCARPARRRRDSFDDEAIDLLAERLTTPLQIVQHLTLALEAAFQIGGQPVTTEVVESVLAKDINEMEANADAARLWPQRPWRKSSTSARARSANSCAANCRQAGRSELRRR